MSDFDIEQYLEEKIQGNDSKKKPDALDKTLDKNRDSESNNRHDRSRRGDSEDRKRKTLDSSRDRDRVRSRHTDSRDRDRVRSRHADSRDRDRVRSKTSDSRDRDHGRNKNSDDRNTKEEKKPKDQESEADLLAQRELAKKKREIGTY